MRRWKLIVCLLLAGITVAIVLGAANQEPQMETPRWLVIDGNYSVRVSDAQLPKTLDDLETMVTHPASDMPEFAHPKATRRPSGIWVIDLK